MLHKTMIDTPLGEMVAIANDNALVLLEFTDQKGLSRALGKLGEVKASENDVTRSIREELAAYFKGRLQSFKTPIEYSGTAFQKDVWDALERIPYGQTRSYADQAEMLGKASAIRAVAAANGANALTIITPCHRVVGKDGSLTGYAGGLQRKEWLLAHEAAFSA